MYFSMTDGPPSSNSDNYAYYWLQDTVEAHELLLDKIVCFAMSDFGGAHAAFRLMITWAVHRYGLLLRTLPSNACLPYLTIADRAVRYAIFQILDVSKDVQTLDTLNCAERQLFLPAEFGGLNVPPLELDGERAHYAYFTATLANMTIGYESESLRPVYGLIRQGLMHVVASTLPWVIQLRNSYDTSSNMGGVSESDLVVLTNTLNKDLCDYDGPDVELVVSPANIAEAPAT
jgi:hypothetical protein